jgi:RES domain
VTPPLRHVCWATTHRIVCNRHPAISLFEDIADPADWNAILSALAKTDPAAARDVGNLGLVPPARRVAGPGASWAMAPFTHVSHDRPSRFSDGAYGLYYAGDRLAVAIYETIHGHEQFMRRTAEPPGWTSDFLHLTGALDARLHDVDALPSRADVLDPANRDHGRALGRALRTAGSDGVVYASVRFPEGTCVGLFWPDVAGIPAEGDAYAYEWDGARVTRIHNLTTGELRAA